MLFETNVRIFLFSSLIYLTFINYDHRLYATGKTCHNNCSGGIVIAVNPSFVATGDVQRSAAQTDMSVNTKGIWCNV